MDCFFTVTEIKRHDFPLLEYSKTALQNPINENLLDKPIVKEISSLSAAEHQQDSMARVMGNDVTYRQNEVTHGFLEALNISPEYKNCLVDRIQNMDTGIKDLYDRYAGRLVCLDPNYPGTSYFSSTEGGFRVDQSADGSNVLGAGSTFFHESAHMLDWLIGKENGAESISSLYRLTDAVAADLNDALTSIMRSENCTYEKAQQLLSSELQSHWDVSFCVSDVFGGLTGNKVSGFWGHTADYWANRDRDGIGKEAFAEITQQRVCNPGALAYTQKMMPRTYEAYQNIVTNAARYNK